MADSVPSCELCRDAGGRVLWSDGQCRLVRVDDPDYPGYCRVIWNQHRSEMTDLAPAEQRHLMMVVLAAEAALRASVQPDKINLASLGNMTPHLHWHIIPRWRDDRHFPQPIWGAPQRPSSARVDVADAVLRGRFVAALAEEQGG
jgi:diadenosine tetraphosphate (Ap4A) HIT family hydrolase